MSNVIQSYVRKKRSCRKEKVTLFSCWEASSASFSTRKLPCRIATRKTWRIFDSRASTILSCLLCLPGWRSQFECFAGSTPWKTRWYSTRAARHGKHDRTNLSWKTCSCRIGFNVQCHSVICEKKAELTIFLIWPPSLVRLDSRASRSLLPPWHPAVEKSTISTWA